MKILAVDTKELTWSDPFNAWIGEASEIGLAPGEWPAEIELYGEPGSAVWYIATPMSHSGQFVGYNYANASTVTLKIYND